MILKHKLESSLILRHKHDDLWHNFAFDSVFGSLVKKKRVCVKFNIFLAMLWHFLVSAPDTRLKHRVPKNKIDFLSCLTTIHPFYLEAHLVAWTWNRICVKRSLIIRQDSNWILCTVYYISYNAHFRGKYGFVEYKVRHFPHLTLPLVQNIYSMYPYNMCSSYLHQLYICLDYIIILLWKVRAMGTWIFRVLLFPILACMPYCMNISEQTNKQTSSSHKVHCAIIAVCICEEEVSLA